MLSPSSSAAGAAWLVLLEDGPAAPACASVLPEHSKHVLLESYMERSETHPALLCIGSVEGSKLS